MAPTRSGVATAHNLPATPHVASVVVPTHNRSSLLGRLVDALDAQEGVPSFEIIIVDDGSTDDTWGRLEKLSAATAHSLRTIRLAPSKGPGEARNAGWKSANAPVVAFIDDDCTPQPGWLQALVESLGDLDIVQGQTIPDPAQQDRSSAFSRSVTVTQENGLYETCNIAYRRAVLEETGGFDEGFRRPYYGEDVDLAWRAKAKGARTGYSAAALAYHEVWPGTFRGQLYEIRRLQGAVHALSAHPQLRGALHRRVFVRESHPSALLAGVGLVGLAAARRSLLGTAAITGCLLPYLYHRLRHPVAGTSPRDVQWIPVALVNDLAEIVVLAAASIRHRRFVL